MLGFLRVQSLAYCGCKASVAVGDDNLYRRMLSAEMRAQEVAPRVLGLTWTDGEVASISVLAD